MNSDIRVAAAVMKSIPGRPDINLSRMREMVRSAAEDGVEILCFPEACITGYGIDPGVGDFAGTRPRPFLRRGAGYGPAIGSNRPCGASSRKANTGRCILRNSSHRLTGFPGFTAKRISAPPEKGLFEAGNDVPVFRDRGGRIRNRPLL